ncbi:MAG: tRNA pseudouridine(38-40) synthase TruA [Actinomycetaceae bacterium]|nr:tRNA pseudouridine(38-40) synthase TruA [Actinomycetaceae bacterium]
MGGLVDPLRVRLDIRYRGTAFHGWAAQPGLVTVQGAVEDALGLLLRVPVTLTVAGRTDAGVHALAQVAHFDVEESRVRALARDGALENGLQLLRNRLNTLLARGSDSPGSDVVILAVRAVNADFDARFSAVQRRYRYRISDSVTTRDPLTADAVWWVNYALDVDAMSRAAQHLLGEHDFLSFCKPREGATTIRTLRAITVSRDEHGIFVELRADAFCHSMVRSIVGALVEVGRGRRSDLWVKELVDNPGRLKPAPVAPAHGLTMLGVDYPDPKHWADQQHQTRRRRGECDEPK